MNYRIYRLSLKEVLLFSLEYLIMDAAVTFLFFDELKVFFLLLPGFAVFLKKRRGELIISRKKELGRQFTDMILAVSTALGAGYSVENSFREAFRDMAGLYGKDSLICMELSGFFRKMEAGRSLEEVLTGFAERSGIEEIMDFTEIFSIAKRNGGDFAGMIRRTVSVMREKDETEREIEVLLSGKRFEQRIMGVIPLFIILYLRLSTGEFLAVLYHNPAGITVMLICLVIYLLSFGLAERIVAIEV
ncbi:MAG TPA: hypothetical protein DCL38_11115 [Lachnospiraceae bacterium]|nr:hypothetical protein [Lachnospiraceae bacterium]